MNKPILVNNSKIMNLFYAPRYCRFCGESITGVNWGHVACQAVLHCPRCHSLLKKIEDLSGWIV